MRSSVNAALESNATRRIDRALGAGGQGLGRQAGVADEGPVRAGAGQGQGGGMRVHVTTLSRALATVHPF